MPTFRSAAWSDQKIADCAKELDTLFFEAVGKGEKRMNPRAVDIINKDRIDIAETLVNLIQQQVENVNPLPFLVDEVEGDIRNSYIWQEMDSSLRVVSRSMGSKPLSQRLTFKEYSMSTSHKEVGVELPLEEVFAGRTSPSLAASEMALAITRYRVANTVDLLDAAVPASADRTGISGWNLRYTDAGALTQPNLDKAIDGLQDESENPTVFGRHVSLHPAIRAFTGFSGYSNETKRDFEQRGQIGTYHGANIVTLRDPWAKRSGDHLIRKDRVYVASGTKGAIYMTQPVNFLNYAFTDPRTATFGTGIRLADGLLVYDFYRYRILTVNPS